MSIRFSLAFLGFLAAATPASAENRYGHPPIIYKDTERFEPRHRLRAFFPGARRRTVARYDHPYRYGHPVGARRVHHPRRTFYPYAHPYPLRARAAHLYVPPGADRRAFHHPYVGGSVLADPYGHRPIYNRPICCE